MVVNINMYQSYKDLKVWQKSIELVVKVYKLTENFPQSEIYGLVNQMRRAAVAMPSNIAEGQRRGHQKEFLRFLLISYSSGAELETQIEICKNIEKLNVLDYSEVDLVLEEAMKMLNVLISMVKKNI